MATLTFTAGVSAPATAPAKKAGFFNRLMHAMMESRRRRAQIEIRRAMALSGEPRERLDYAMLPFSGE